LIKNKCILQNPERLSDVDHAEKFWLAAGLAPRFYDSLRPNYPSATQNARDAKRRLTLNHRRSKQPFHFRRRHPMDLIGAHLVKS
jgi:hypothetical protein